MSIQQTGEIVALIFPKQGEREERWI